MIVSDTEDAISGSFMLHRRTCNYTVLLKTYFAAFDFIHLYGLFFLFVFLCVLRPEHAASRQHLKPLEAASPVTYSISLCFKMISNADVSHDHMAL